MPICIGLHASTGFRIWAVSDSVFPSSLELNVSLASWNSRGLFGDSDSADAKRAYVACLMASNDVVVVQETHDIDTNGLISQFD